jgi:hypothetical protein
MQKWLGGVSPARQATDAPHMGRSLTQDNSDVTDMIHKVKGQILASEAELLCYVCISELVSSQLIILKVEVQSELTLITCSIQF